MIIKLKQLFKKNPFLYKIWFYVKMAGGKLFLPQKTHDFFLDGFERSGNSYLVQLLDYVFGKKLKFSHHLHNIAPIKIAMALNLDIWIAIRKPQKPIASFVIMRKFYGNTNGTDKLIDLILNDWIEYYDFVKSKCPNAKFIVIDDQFNDTLFLSKISSIYNLENTKGFKETIADFKISYERLNKKKSFERTNIPNAKRDIEKSKIEKKLKNNKNFDRATEIYNQINEQI